MWWTIVTGCTLLLAGCSRGVLSTVLDLPPQAERPPAQETQGTGLQVPEALLRSALFQPEDTVRPEIENFLEPDTVKALLPRDHAGNIDWMAALREEIIKPRDRLPSDDPALPRDEFEFKFDFFFPGPDTTLNAYFPHSSHTQWVDCQQCHARIFPYRNTPVSMGEIFQGKYCGECHGKVAFPVVSDCERCHVNLQLPPNRVQGELIGTITIPRAAAARDPDSVVAALGEQAVGQSLFQAASLPPAQFPHWVHRIRFKCKVCHLAIFEPRAGANEITMEKISRGEACGVCHNGLTAFAAGFGECQRCHVPAAASTGG